MPLLMSPMGGLRRSFSFRATCSYGGSFFSLLMNLCNFPYLIRASICCFKSQQSDVSWPWLQWKQQYLSLGLLLGSPFNLLGNVKDPLSLICIRNWLIGAVSGVKLVNLLVGGLECVSSRRSPFLFIFHRLSCHASSCLSLFLSFYSQVSNASSAFMYLVSLYSTFDIVFGTFWHKENRNLPFRNPFVNVDTSILLSASLIERASLLKRVI